MFQRNTMRYAKKSSISGKEIFGNSFNRFDWMAADTCYFGRSRSDRVGCAYELFFIVCVWWSLGHFTPRANERTHAYTCKIPNLYGLRRHPNTQGIAPVCACMCVFICIWWYDAKLWGWSFQSTRTVHLPFAEERCTTHTFSSAAQNGTPSTPISTWQYIFYL